MKFQDQRLYYTEFPKGKDYYEWIFSLDNKKEIYTTELYELDKEFNSNETYESVPVFLEIIYKIATCGYGCKGVGTYN